jgi:SH3 domain-containing protein
VRVIGGTSFPPFLPLRFGTSWHTSLFPNTGTTVLETVGMKRLLISLWVIGGVLYLISTVLFTNAVNLFGNDDPSPVAKEASPPVSLPMAPAAATPSDPSQQPEQLEAVSQTAINTPHAISPDEDARGSAGEESRPSLGRDQPSTDRVAEGPPNDAGRVKVTSAASIRSGPSTAATVIGTAHAGGEAQVASRKGGWVQIIDPASSRTGWIYSKFIAPVTANNEAVATRTPVANPQQAAKQESKGGARSSRRQVAPGASTKQIAKRWPPPEFAELPTDEEFLPPRKRGRFGIFAKRRMMREGLLEPDQEFRR